MLPLKRLVKAIAKVETGDDNVKITTKSDVFEDNNGALTVATLPRIIPQSKFFAVKCHFFREHVKTESNPQGEIHIQKVATEDQLADIMTKGLVEDKFKPLRDRLMGWDLERAVTPKRANRHSRGSVEKVSLVRSSQQAVQLVPTVTNHGGACDPRSSPSGFSKGFSTIRRDEKQSPTMDDS